MLFSNTYDSPTRPSTEKDNNSKHISNDGLNIWCTSHNILMYGFLHSGPLLLKNIDKNKKTIFSVFKAIISTL
jgi:hypothetical protein